MIHNHFESILSHELVYTRTEKNVRLHKDQCWTEQEVKVERDLLNV